MSGLRRDCAAAEERARVRREAREAASPALEECVRARREARAAGSLAALALLVLTGAVIALIIRGCL